MSGFEIAGIVFGVAGLYGSCVDAATRVQSYNSFISDSQALNAQFQAERLRLEIWGDRVGLKHLISSHEQKLDPLLLEQQLHGGLQDSKILQAVEDLLSVIENICLANDSASSLKKPPRTNSGMTSAGPVEYTRGSLAGASTKHRRRKLAWAFGGKEESTTQIKLFCSLVQQLHNLVPIQDNTERRSGEEQKGSLDAQTGGKGKSASNNPLPLFGGTTRKLRLPRRQHLGLGNVRGSPRDPCKSQ